MDSHNKTYFSLFYTPIMDSQKLLVDNVKDNKVYIAAINCLELCKPKYFNKINFPVHWLGIESALYNTQQMTDELISDKWPSEKSVMLIKRRNII